MCDCLLCVIMTASKSTCELYLPLLKALADGKPKQIAALPDKIGQIYCVLPDDLGIREPKDGSCDYLEPMVAASAELAKACLITKSADNSCQITERDLALLKENPSVVDDAVLRRYPEYTKR